MENKNQLIKVTISSVLALWIAPHLLGVLPMNTYFYTIIHALLFSSIVLYLFNYYKAAGSKQLHLFIIAIGLPILLYTLDFLGYQVYYFFNPVEKEEILRFTTTFEYKGFYANMERFHSPLAYSLFDAVTNKSMRTIYQFIAYNNYGLALITFLQYPVVLLLGFLKKAALQKKKA